MVLNPNTEGAMQKIMEAQQLFNLDKKESFLFLTTVGDGTSDVGVKFCTMAGGSKDKIAFAMVSVLEQDENLKKMFLERFAKTIVGSTGFSTHIEEVSHDSVTTAGDLIDKMGKSYEEHKKKVESES